MRSKIDMFVLKVFIITFYLFIYYQFCQMTGSYKRTNYKSAPPHIHTVLAITCLSIFVVQFKLKILGDFTPKQL